MMSNLYEQIVGQRGGLEALIARIPGFRGYINKGDRRQADRMLRDYVADELTKRLNRMMAIELSLVDAGNLTYMTRTGRIRQRLQTFRDRVQGATPGYSGFGEAIKVDEEALGRIYSFDEALIRYADQLDSALQDFSTAANGGTSDALNTAIEKLDAISTEANEAFGLRDQVLTNLDKALSGG